MDANKKRGNDLHIIRLALVKMTCNACQEQECEGCPLEPYKVVKDYFEKEV
ncbi:MAG: hypothetical protein ACTSRU_19515 [Candidatus Hodarchaeales archaeon]